MKFKEGQKLHIPDKGLPEWVTVMNALPLADGVRLFALDADGRLLPQPVDPARDHRLWPFFHVAAYTGARRGELLHLRWSDVDLEGKQITIRGSASFISGERVEGTTKSGRKRVVSLDARTVQVFRAQRSQQAADKLQLGPEWRGVGDYVFTTGWGEPIHPDTLSSLFPILIKRYNQANPDRSLPPARLHDLRHVHATTLLLAGVPVHVVAARLGHADPSITLRVYAHVIRAAEASAADAFAQAIGDELD